MEQQGEGAVLGHGLDIQETASRPARLSDSEQWGWGGK